MGAAYNVVVTEKPSVARTFAEVLGVHSDEKTDGYIKGNGWIITWCLGHLVTLSYPEKYDPALKKWKLETLPFLPSDYRYEVIDDARTKKQFRIVSEILNRKDIGTIYNAGDSGREGEYIQRLVYTKAGAEGKKEIRRVWIDSQTREEILRGIAEAKPESAYNNIYYAAVERGIEDYAIGINLSRAMSIRFGSDLQKAGSKDYIKFSVGRVMTCVLGMIVDRENEILNFTETPYYEIEADHSAFISNWKTTAESKFYESPLLYNESGFKSKEDAEKLLDEFNSDPFLTVIKNDRKQEKKSAPLLFNLAELQSECTKRFKVSPAETLDALQHLYEKGLTTYPRTDARVISSAVAKEIRINIVGIKNVLLEMADNIDTILRGDTWKNIANTRYTNDEKITDHYAVIPTGQGNLEGVSELEKKVYRLVVKRFLAIFYPAALYEKYDVEFTHSNGEHFFVVKRLLKDPGYLAVYGKAEEDVSSDEDPDDDTNMLQYVEPGNMIPAEFSVKDKKTQPPKRYTSGSMILAMEHAGKLIEDEELRAQIKECGIGTSATRAECLKKLESIKYISLDKKTQILKPTETGTKVVAHVGKCMKEMLSPAFTASWEKGLAHIEEGAIDPSVFRGKVEDFVRRKVEFVKAQEPAAPVRPQIEKTVAGKCPACGADLIYTKEYGYYCSARRSKDKKTCQFAIWNTMTSKGHDTKTEIVEPLLKGGPTEYMEFANKEGKTFTARLVIKEDGSVGYEYKQDESGIKCPACSKNLMQNERYYSCSCGFSFPKILASHTFSEEEMNELYKNGKIEGMTGFKKKDGSPFKGPATVIYKDGRCSFDFGKK